jgi:hypothetical protein
MKKTCVSNYLVSLIDWISDTFSQECTGLQSLVKCLDHRDIVSDTVSNMTVNAAFEMHFNAFQCIAQPYILHYLVSTAVTCCMQ